MPAFYSEAVQQITGKTYFHHPVTSSNYRHCDNSSRAGSLHWILNLPGLNPDQLPASMLMRVHSQRAASFEVL